MMAYTWERQIPCESGWPAWFSGFFFRKSDKVFFFYYDMNKVCALEHKAVAPMAISFDFPVHSRWLPYLEKPQRCITLPSEWLLFEDHDPPYLMLNSTVGIDLLHLKPCDALPPAATEYYLLQKRSPKNGSLLLQAADYVVRARGERGYVCERNGLIQWKFSGSAYLYTPMICFQDSLIFGTAGNGGHFYVLSIETGEKIADIKTGGTVAFVQQNNLCYFLVNDPNAKLVCLDILTGQIIDEVHLGGKNSYSPLQLIGNQLHTVTFYFEDGMLEKAIWHCVTLTDGDSMLK